VVFGSQVRQGIDNPAKPGLHSLQDKLWEHAILADLIGRDADQTPRLHGRIVNPLSYLRTEDDLYAFGR